MKKLASCVIFLPILFLLCGFDWGGQKNSCSKAMSHIDSLDTAYNEVRSRQIEAEIKSLCPDGAAGHYVNALMFERVGNIDGAITEYRQALRQEPNFPRASGNLGLLYAQQGKNNEASVELTRGLTAPSSAKYHKALGRVLADMNVYSLAVYHLAEAGNTLVRDSEVFTRLAEVRLAMGQPSLALEEYGRALNANPADDNAYIGIATIYLKQNDLDKALEQLKKAEMANPQNRKTHLMMAEIYEKKGNAKQANFEYLLSGSGKNINAEADVASKPAKVLVQSPQAPVPTTIAATQTPKPVLTEDLRQSVKSLQKTIKDSPENAAETYGKLGDIYRLSGKDQEAIAAYKEAEYLDTSDSNVYLNLGILYEKHDNLDEAVVAYKEAVRVNPKNANARFRLAEIRNTRGFYQEALEQYGEFLKLKPNSPDVQLKVARLLAKNKEIALAIGAYGSVLKSAPNNADANREIAALYRINKLDDKAIEHYKKALDQQKDDTETRNALVSLYVKNKQYDDITALLKEAAELFPDDPNNHYKLGLICEFRKSHNDAIANYKKAIELKPDHARALNALGRLYMKTGRTSEAREALDAARKADPNLEETTSLQNNDRDEFSPEPRGIIHRRTKSRPSRKNKAKQAKASSRKPKSKASTKTTNKTSKKTAAPAKKSAAPKTKPADKTKAKKPK